MVDRHIGSWRCLMLRVFWRVPSLMYGRLYVRLSLIWTGAGWGMSADNVAQPEDESYEYALMTARLEKELADTIQCVK